MSHIPLTDEELDEAPPKVLKLSYRVLRADRNRLYDLLEKRNWDINADRKRIDELRAECERLSAELEEARAQHFLLRGDGYENPEDE